ncbi:sulfotransferase [Luteimonas sp. 50]|uniref:Sulfotransferase n=1 Tax=Cognatiluteimonas sedimenti TaxID=2927791 RepID=A0ABT0A0I6_9GAMM|nr:sulfotransferase [Lysobacter sedimenti]MCJ0824491.1 sulfotransferase [Lysobacter sedimenti]
MQSPELLHLWQAAERHLGARDLAAASTAYRQLVGDAQFGPLAQLRLSLIATAQRHYRDAVDAAMAAFDARVSDADLLEMIAKRLSTFGESQAMLACTGDQAVQQATSIQTLAELGKLLSDASFPGQALPLLQRARKLGLDTPVLGHLIALCLMYTGDAEAAERELLACLKTEPDMPLALWGLGKLRLEHGAQGRIDGLRRAIAKRETADPDSELALLHYSLFAELDRRDEIEPAWQALAEGMRLRRAQMRHDTAAEQALFDHMASLRPQPVAGAPDDGPRPVFIVGMPRSGTTLLERVLGNHPDVTDAGELRDLVRQLRWMCDLGGPSQLDLALARRAESIDFAELGRRYLAHTQWRAQGRAVYTDKMPANFLNVSYIARALPQARILHMVRGPMDTCFSNLKEWFAGAYPHSYDQLEMADHYRRYRTLMAQWRAQYPDRILDVRYDELVADPERVAREVLEFCGLPWQAGLSVIEQRSDSVATASAMQVREPIHGRFLEQWRRYEAHLGPLRERLGALAY